MALKGKKSKEDKKSMKSGKNNQSDKSKTESGKTGKPGKTGKSGKTGESGKTKDAKSGQLEVKSNKKVQNSKKKNKAKQKITCIMAVVAFLIILCSGVALGGVGVPKVRQWLIEHNFTSEKTFLLPSEDGTDQNSDDADTNDPQGVRQEVIIQENMFVDVVDEVQESVVSIAISQDEIGVSPDSGKMEDSVNIGTGFVIDKDGLIMTNQHVVSQSGSDYIVVTPDGKEYEVEDIARDNVNDIAILRVDADDLPALTVGDSDALEVGQYVVAIGNPLGEFPGSVTVGVVSGLGRSITASSRGTAHTYENVIQTDAAINPGNSGGPLLDIKGNVIGVNFATTSGADNLSFAIPINSVTERIGEYKRHGKFIKPFLGVEYAIISPTQARFYRDVVAGAYISNVIEGSPADEAGIQSEDIITKIDGEDVGNSLYLLIQNKEVGDRVEVEVWRDGETETMEVKLEEAPDL
jgi:S1-C subfamily serine protease